MESLFYEDIALGRPLLTLTKGPMTTAHIMRWSAAMENWHRIHYDYRFATGHDKLPDVLVNGSWKQHVLVQLMKDALGPESWLWKIRFRYQKMDIAGDTIIAEATATEKRVIDDMGFIVCRLVMRDQNQIVSTAGSAIAAIALRNGPKVPYPFVPKPEYSALDAIK